MVNSDSPIKSYVDDELNRLPFVQNFGRSITSAPHGESIVFAIYSKWGDGKSSALALLKEQFENKELGEPPHLIEFNPWIFSGRKTLLFALVIEIGNALNNGKLQIENAHQKAQKFKEFAAILKLSSYVVPTGLATAMALSEPSLLWGVAEVSALKNTVVWLAKLFKSAGDAKASKGQPSVSTVKKDLETELSDLKKPILVVLDDVDRLLPDEQLEIFQIIKCTVSLPNINYLILADKEVLEQNLEKLKLGKDYLKKIVQYGVELPKIRHEELRETLEGKLHEIIASYKLDMEGENNKIEESGFWRLFDNLRDVKRFLGEFSIILPNHCTNGVLELHTSDLLNLHTIRYFHPHIYKNSIKVENCF